MTTAKKETATPWHKSKLKVGGILLAILLTAFTLRFTDNGHLPSGLFPDEAENGIDAITANTTGQYKLFYEANNGREGLFINLQALSLKVFGDNIAALRLWSNIFGTLTVLGVFLLGSELFGTYLAGLIGAWLTTFAYWAINFSRIGFRAVMVPFILTFAFYFLYRGLRTKKLHDFIFAGLIYGLGLHTYIAFRVSPLVLIMLFISLLITRENFLKNFWKHTLVFIIAMLITSAPMLLDFFYWNPQHYASRTSEISILNPATNQGHLLPLLGKTFGLSLAKYNFWGDQNMRQNYPPYPILNPITGVAFLIGLIYIFSKFFHLLWNRFRKGVRDKKLEVYVLILAWFFTLLIPEFLAAEGNPQALRAIGTIPVVMLIATLPFLWIIRKINSFGHSFKILVISMLIFAFGFIAIFDTVKYFFFFANNPKQKEAFDANLTDAAYWTNSLDSSTEKYILADEYTLRPQQFISHDTKNIFYTWPSHLDFIAPQTNNFVILLPDPKAELIKQVQEKFPNLKMYEHGKQNVDLFIEFKP